MDHDQTTWRYTLTDNGECGKLYVDEDGYITCPRCRKRRLARLGPQTREVWIELLCKRCGPVELHIMREP